MRANTRSLQKDFWVIWAIGALCFLAPARGLGQDVKFSRISLEDLLNLEVSVSSVKTEKIIETPAVVSRFDREDLEKMGLTNLKDILSFIPGFVVQDASIGTTPVMIRGAVDGFNQKVLFLLDGVPYFQPTHSIIATLGVPIESISHVEVVRGSGTVIYGTNASGGVINVVTRKEGEDRVALSGGSNRHYNTSVYLGHAFNDDARFFLAFESQVEDGYLGEFIGANPAPAFFPPGDYPAGGPLPKSEEMTSVLAHFNYMNFNIMAQYYESVTEGLAGRDTLVNRGDLEDTGTILHLNNTWEMEKASIKAYTDYNNFYLNLPIEKLDGVTDGGARFVDERQNYRLRTGLTANLEFTSRTHLFLGAESEERSSGRYELYNGETGATLSPLIPEQRITERSFFAQFDFDYKKWRLLIGGRFTDNDQSGSDMTPRAAIVFKIDKKQSVKLLCSTGFNSPNFVQTSIFLQDVLSGAPNLRAETIETLDFVYSHAAHNNLFVANIYYWKAKDFIGRGPRPGQFGSFYFNNPESFDRVGAELDYQKAAVLWKVFANMAYNHEGNEKIDDDPTALFVPKITLSAGAGFQFSEVNYLGGSLRYIGARGAADAMSLINLSYRYERSWFQLFASVRNLLDKDIRHVDVLNFVPHRLVPGGDKINFLVGARVYF